MARAKSRIATVILALGLAACGRIDTASEVRSIEEVTADQPPQVVNITSSDAVLEFESSIPLACSAVYGETTEYGMIATDTDMAGGAHANHHPLLAGLRPDTLYHYRVQGAAPDGTLYQSRDFTFRTLPADESGETNWASLVAGATVSAVSSNFGGAANDEQWGANGAIDGNRGTAWSSDGDGDDAFLEVSLPEVIQISAVEVWSRSMSDGSAQILSFSIETDRGETLGPFELSEAEGEGRFEVEATARRVRLIVEESTGGNTGLVELAVYGEPAG